MRIVEQGEDPKNVLRDPSENEILVYPVEHFEYPGYEGTRHGPFRDLKVRNDVEAELSGEGAQRPEWDGVATAADSARTRRGSLALDM